jgi:hypothetical protein
LAARVPDRIQTISTRGDPWLLQSLPVPKVQAERKPQAARQSSALSARLHLRHSNVCRSGITLSGLMRASSISTPAEAFAEARKIVNNKIEGPKK